MRTAVALLMLLAGSARADHVTESGTHRSYSHKGQFGVHAHLGVGYRSIGTYDASEYCGQADKRYCWGDVPPFVDLGLSYGVSHKVELVVEARLGVGAEFKDPRNSAGAPRALALSPGARIYIDDSGSSKFFTSIQVAFDFTDYSASGNATGTDVGLRNVNGYLLDFHRTFGLYGFVGGTLGFVRWFRFEIDAGGGIQIRFP